MKILTFSKMLAVVCTIGFTVFSYTSRAVNYYSQGNGNFSSLTNWNTNPGGGGSNPSSVRAGTDVFYIQTGHEIIVDDSINIAGLNISGILKFGNNTTARSMWVNGNITVNNTGSIEVASFNATHRLTLNGGNLINNGAVNLRPGASNRVVNLTTRGTVQIQGTNSPTLSNLNVQTGTLTPTIGLTIKGDLTIQNSTTFNSGALTHTITGNFNNSGTFNRNTSTWVFNSPLAQVITGTNITFHNLTVDGGGVLSLSQNFTVDNSFLVTSNSKVDVLANIRFNGSFTIDAGSEYEGSSGETQWYGSGTQNITLSGTASFYNLNAQYGTKNIIGNLDVNAIFYIFSSTIVQDGAPGQVHTFRGTVRLDGTANFTNKVILKSPTGASIYHNTTGSTITFGPADIDVEGYTWVGSSDTNQTTLHCQGNLNILSHYLVIRFGSNLTGTSSKSFIQQTNTNLYVRGTDNYPSGFGTYTHEYGSYVRYDWNADQTIRGGITYPHLVIDIAEAAATYTKTISGNIVVNGNLYVRPQADSAQLNLHIGNNNVELRGNLEDSYDPNQVRKVVINQSGGTFTLNGIDNNQYFYRRDASSQYSFNNFSIVNRAPTTERTKYFVGDDQTNPGNSTIDLTVLGDFTVVNESTNPANVVNIDLNNIRINGNSSGTFALGNNVRVLVGSNQFGTSVNSFVTTNLDANSTVRYDANIGITIPSITYGNLELGGTGGTFYVFEHGITVLGNFSRHNGTPTFRLRASKAGVNPNHQIRGNWNLTSAYIDATVSGLGRPTVTFNGNGTQYISEATFWHVSYGGTGEKILQGNQTIQGDVNIGNGVTINSYNYNYTVGGNWTNLSDGQFLPTTGTVTFNGTFDQTISIQNGNGSYFYNLTINKTSGTALIANSNLGVHNNFTFVQNQGDFNLNGNTLTVGGNWVIQPGCEFIWSAGAKIIFNNNSGGQLIRNYRPLTTYPTMEFTGSGVKRFYDNPLYIEGDIILNGATLTGEWWDHYLKGNLINNSGTFQHYRTLYLNGNNQYIGSGQFQNIYATGNGTKYLTAHWDLLGSLTIDTSAVVDVSPDNGATVYNITIEEHWYNNLFNANRTKTGQFIPRTGTVTFIGNWSNIYTGDSIGNDHVGRPGKQFYNLVVNNRDNQTWTRLYPISDPVTPSVKTYANDLRVLNNFTLENGIFYLYWNKMYVGGSFKNLYGNFQMNIHYSGYPKLYLEGNTGPYDFNPGDNHLLRYMEFIGNGEYILKNQMIVDNSETSPNLVFTGGIFRLAQNVLQLNNTTRGDVIIGIGATLYVDSLSELRIPNTRTLTNNGTFKLVGTPTGIATLRSTSGNFNFVQNSGTTHAKYYNIENTSGKGMRFVGGTIDATENFSDGRFMAGAGGAGTAYLSILSGATFNSDRTITNVTFNSGPVYNVYRDAGTGSGIFTFHNAGGSLAGATYEYDPGNVVNWTNEAAKYWTGLGGNSQWTTAANWSDNQVPTINDNVYLDNTYVVGAYSVNIQANATCKSLNLKASATTLSINNGKLTILNDLTILTGNTLTQVNSADSIILGGSFTNAGTFNPGTSVVKFNPVVGNHTIVTKATDTFYELIIDGTGGSVVLGSNIIVTGHIKILNAELNASNKTMNIRGNWTASNTAFNASTSIVRFERNDGTPQYIDGGRFYDILFAGSSEKIAQSTLFIDRDLTINAGARFNGGTQTIYVTRHWYNYEGNNGFTQTGGGKVVFNAVGVTSYIGNYNSPTSTKETTFNHLSFEGIATRYIANNLTINGNLFNVSGSNLYVGAVGFASTQIIGTAGCSFNMDGGILYLLGTESFPKNFGGYNISGGTVEYRGPIDQIITGGVNIQYFNLYFRNTTNGSPNPKRVKTANGDLYVNGSVYIYNQNGGYDGPCQLNMNNYDLYLIGGLSFENPIDSAVYQINWGTGTLYHNGGNFAPGSNVTLFNNLVKAGTGVLTQYNNYTLTGNMHLDDGINLNMQTYKITCIAASKSFEIGANSYIYSYIVDTSATITYAFPTGFSSYTIHPTNSYYLRGTHKQSILPGVTYGNVYLNDNFARETHLHGDLIVQSNLIVNSNLIQLIDNGYNIYLGGASADLRNYTASSTSTFFFNGEGNQQIYAGGGFNEVRLNHLATTNKGGIKNLNTLNFYFTGNITIAANDTVTTPNNIYFSGNTLTNNGRFDHTARIFRFQGAAQTIKPGNNRFNEVYFANSGTLTVEDAGFNIRQNITISGTGNVNFGSLTHNIGSNNIYIIGSGGWNVSNSNLIFDRNGDQYIPGISARNVSFTTGGNKYLLDSISVEDLYVGTNVNFRSTEDPNFPYNISVRGNWTVEGNFTPYTNTVYFESPNSDPKTILSGGRSFYNVVFNSVYTNNRIYTLSDNMTITENTTLYSGAHLKLNGKNLTLGNDDTSTPPGEITTIASGATLEVDAGAQLLFNLADLDPTFNIYGTLILVGDNTNTAVIKEFNSAGWNRGIAMRAYSGANLKFNYYKVERLNYNGFVIDDGVTIDPLNNFSNGLWMNMYPNNQYIDPADGVTIRDRFYYMRISANTTSIGNIENVVFQHPTTPIVGRHYNIYRPTGCAGNINLAGDITGNMGSETYELDPNNQVFWPTPSKVVWRGVVNSDWFEPGNWNPPTVPTSNVDAEIPRITTGGSNPVIYYSGAICRDLILTNGFLTIEAGVDTVKVSRHVTMGASSILAFGSDAVLFVTGNYDINSTANVVESQSTVLFKRNSGTSLITPRNSSFYNIKFNGNGTYNLVGASLTFNGNWQQLGGNVVPSTDNYNYYLKGNYEYYAGTYSTTNNGYFNLNGNNQTIKNGIFSRLSLQNGGIKSFTDSTIVAFTGDAFRLRSGVTMKLNTNSAVVIAGNFDSESGAILDNSGSVYFRGTNWRPNHDVLGNGWVNFTGGDQNVYGGKFTNVRFNNSSPAVNNWKTLYGNLIVNNDVVIDNRYFTLQSYTINNSTTNGTFQVGMNVNGNVNFYVNGYDNFPSGFSEYQIHPLSITAYESTSTQLIRGKTSDIDINYGTLRLRNSTKNLNGDIGILGSFNIDVSGVTFNSLGYTIQIAGNWNNNSSGGSTYNPGGSEVIFNGSVDQYINLTTASVNNFSKIRVNKQTSTNFVRATRELTVSDKLWVRKGQFETTTTLYVGGDFLATDEGLFRFNGTYVLNKSLGNASISGNNSRFFNLIVNGGATYNVLDNFRIDGNFQVTAGEFNLNGNTLSLGDGSDVANISAKFTLGAGGTIRMGNNGIINVDNGGILEVIGTSTLTSTITGNTSGDRYYLNVNSGGTIKARDYYFSGMALPGVYVKSGATIDPQNNFSKGSFSNPQAGGVCLQIENNQYFIGSDSIYSLRFPQNPLSGTRNIKKINSLGVIDIYDWSGDLAGPNYEDDPYNLVNWNVVNTITWVGGYGTGSTRYDWNVPQNWDLNRLPTEDDKVVINNTGYACYLRNMPDTVSIRELRVNGPFYLVKEASSNQRVLKVNGYVDIRSDFYFESDSTKLHIFGDLSISSIYYLNTSNGGTIVMDGEGSSTIYSKIWNDRLRLIIAKNGIVNMNFLENKLYYLEISPISQFSLPLNSAAYLLVLSSFINNGQFSNAVATLMLGSFGTFNFKPGSNTLGKIEIVAGTYNLLGNLTTNDNLTIQSGATFVVGNNTVNFGSSSLVKILSVSGTITFLDDSRLRLTDGSRLIIQTTGRLNAIGSLDHEVLFTNQGSGRYEVTINGTIAATYYKFEYLNINGLNLTGSASVDPTNSLSYGTFIFGHPSGRYITFLNTFSDTLEIRNVNFSQGALYNATRTCSCSGIVRFKDSYGLRAGHYFEEDDGTYSGGKIVWTYTTPTLFWTGADDTRWDNPLNWNPEAIPDANSIIFIQSGMPRYPNINSTFVSTEAAIKRLTIYSGASVTLSDNKDLRISENFDNGGSFVVTNGSNSTIKVGGTFSSNGTFANGGSSTLEFNSTNNIELTFGSATPYNLRLNSGNGTGTAQFSTRSAITIQGNFEINAGTLVVTNSSHTITIAGNFVNNSGFTHGNGTFVLNGNSSQSINNAFGSNFFNLQLSGNGEKTLLTNVSILKDLTIGAILNAGNKTIQIKGDWQGTKTFNRGTSTVVFNGTNSQFIDKLETFYNLQINNSAPLTAVALQKTVYIENQLVLTQGKVESGINTTLTLYDNATLVGGSSTTYVKGYLSKIGDDDFVFPIGTDNYYAPIAISGLTSSATFRAGYFEGAYNPTQLQTGLNRASNVEYWNLSRLSGTAEPYVTFYWYNGTRSGIDNLDPLVAAVYETSLGWKSMGKGSTTGNTSAGTVTSANRYNTFGNCGFGWAYSELAWTGNVSSDWTNPNNWDGVNIPNATTNVVINGGATYYPDISSNQSCFKLTLNGTGQITINSGVLLTVSENVTIGTNSQINLNGEIRVAGDWQNDGTVTPGSSSSTVFNGNSTQNIHRIQTRNVTFSGSGAKYLYGTNVVQGNLSIAANVYAQSSTIQLSGNFAINSGTFNYGTSTLELVGSGTQTFTGSQANLYNLTVNNTSGTAPQIVLNSNILVRGHLELTSGIIETSSSYVLSLEEGATSSTGNASSFVAGPMRKYGVTDFVFPIGKGNIFARLAISGMSGSGAFVAEYFNNKYTNVTSIAPTLHHVSKIEYWDLSRVGGVGTAQPYVTLHWEDTTWSRINDLATLRVAHFYSGQWRDMGTNNAYMASTPGAPGRITSSVAFSSFSPITFASTDEILNPLPVQLIRFNATVTEDRSVRLEWETASERNSDRFEIEKSIDGVNFERLATVRSVGNSTTNTIYIHEDRRPFPGISYYRLSQFDMDGKKTEYPMVSVTIIDPSSTELTLYPNPVINSAYITAEQGIYSLAVTVLNSSGGFVSYGEFNGNGERMLDVGHLFANLQPGIYYLLVDMSDQHTILKVIKQ